MFPSRQERDHDDRAYHDHDDDHRGERFMRGLLITLALSVPAWVVIVVLLVVLL
ncbi:hypothetical protein [Gordonia soli]|uniref:Uncharacterized protein n=1 Tax=Gordonia soli NBRC 108243 TaxID=1223545 RepID=M0QHQ6_9ACTN|nr:hypothetical protein [Gordonia soli]GAC67969.1 hypothetical protein GS4_11_02390 [Gordonia soli NBRC 108243]